MRHRRARNAALLLPITSMAEEQGVYVNREGRAQRYLPARTPPGMSRPGWWVAASAWARLADGRTPPGTAGEAFAALAPFDGLTYGALGLTGAVVAASGAGAPR